MRLLQAIETCRRAAKEVAQAELDAIALGLEPSTLLDAVRYEIGDLPAKMEDMRRVGNLLAAAGARTRVEMLLLVDEPIVTDAEMREFEFNQGRVAAVIGRGADESPYPAGSSQDAAWRGGWLEGAKDADG